MVDPYKIYINWTGTYTAGTMSGTFTELTASELFDVNITMSRRRDEKSIAIIRTFADGNFTIKNANYDLLQTAISNGLPELIIKIERYSAVGVAYVEMWRGAVSTRPEKMDDLRKIAILSKFKTIDIYSDIEVAYTKTWAEEFTTYGNQGTEITIEDSPTAGVSRRMRRLFTEFVQDGFNSVNFASELEEKYYSYDTFHLVPGYWDGSWNFYFAGGTATIPRGVWISMAKIEAGDIDTINDIKLSFKKVIDIYRDMFNLHWLAGAAENPDTSAAMDAIQFKHPSELFGVTTIDYTAESADFPSYGYLNENYFIRESFEMSVNNTDLDHVTQYYEYDLLSDIDSKIPHDDIITDFTNIHNANPSYENKDIMIMIAQSVTTSVPGSGLVASNTQINGSARDVLNYKSSLSYRMANNLNDYRQLDEAAFNGSVQALNPTIAAPILEQEPFPITLDLLSDLDFTATIETVIGDTFAQEVNLELKTNVIELICRK